MNISEVAGVPVEFDFDGKKYKVARLSLLDIYGITESDIRSQYLEDIKILTNDIESIKERMEQRRLLQTQCPTGSEMEKLAMERLNSVKGNERIIWLSLSKHAKVSMEEVNTFVNKHPDQVNMVMDIILSLDLKKKEEVSESEKKTEANPSL
jgi:hypothetical protein